MKPVSMDGKDDKLIKLMARLRKAVIRSQLEREQPSRRQEARPSR